MIIGYFTLNETINLLGVLGILLTIGGVIWLTLSKKDSKAAAEVGYARDIKGIMFGIVGALCQGTGLVLSKYGMDYYADKLPTMHAVWIRLLFAFSAAFIISIVTGRFQENSKPIFTNKKKQFTFHVFRNFAWTCHGRFAILTRHSKTRSSRCPNYFFVTTFICITN